MAFKFNIDGETQKIEIIRRRPRLVLRIGHMDYEVIEEPSPGMHHRMRIDGIPVDFAAAREGHIGYVRMNGRSWEVSLTDTGEAAGGLDESANEIRAPMPGVVVALHKAAGDAVRRGETVAIIESMKLQMALAAPRDGTIERLLKKANDSFDKDETIVTLVPFAAE